MPEERNITPEALLAMGAYTTHWNRKWNGGYKEYWFQISQGEEAELTLSVNYEKNYANDPDYMVFLNSGRLSISKIALWNVTTIEQFQALYSLLTGPNHPGQQPQPAPKEYTR